MLAAFVLAGRYATSRATLHFFFCLCLCLQGGVIFHLLPRGWMHTLNHVSGDLAKSLIKGGPKGRFRLISVAQPGQPSGMSFPLGCPDLEELCLVECVPQQAHNRQGITDKPAVPSTLLRVNRAFEVLAVRWLAFNFPRLPDKYCIEARHVALRRPTTCRYR